MALPQIAPLPFDHAVLAAFGRDSSKHALDEHKAWPAAAVEEPSLSERPLEFLCEHSAAAAGTWQPLVWDEARRCFAFHLPGALEPGLAEHFFVRLRDGAPWQSLMDKTKTKVARSTVWWTRNKACNCAYTYGEDTRVQAPADEEFRKTMEDLIHCVFEQFPTLPPEAWPNCANLNLYSEGVEGVGWHADDELIFMGTLRDCPILSLSLGGMREFWIALQSEGAPDARQSIVEVDLRDGDLLTMEGLIQKHCMHCVPRASPSDLRRQQLRINVTFRWMRLHKPQCPYAKVAQTWCMLAQSSQDAVEGCREVATGSVSSAHAGIKILDPVTQKPVRLEGTQKSLRQRRTRGREMTAVMSPVPETARALFGEGYRQFTQEPPRPNEARAFLRGWSTGKLPMGPVKWQPCDACGHTCWGGGRPCQEGEGAFQGQWFCRCCWWGWAETEQEAVPYQYGAGHGDWHYTHGLPYNSWTG